ncbi:hypothetical protein PM082_021733 [Marasmius tenuissimus]|nr:hypothetical protein PM082_021733 [Marasmius tenuissimus]
MDAYSFPIPAKLGFVFASHLIDPALGIAVATAFSSFCTTVSVAFLHVLLLALDGKGSLPRRFCGYPWQLLTCRESKLIRALSILEPDPLTHSTENTFRSVSEAWSTIGFLDLISIGFRNRGRRVSHIAFARSSITEKSTDRAFYRLLNVKGFIRAWTLTQLEVASQVHEEGVPIYCAGAVSAFGVIALLPVFCKEAQVLQWITNLSTTTSCFPYAVMILTYIRFSEALKSEGQRYSAYGNFVNRTTA